MAGRLEGKVCVITGTASGIGAESARLFQSEGAQVVGVDLSPDAVGDLAHPGRRDRSRRTSRACNVEARERFGKIDVLFNNAGISPDDDASILDTSSRGLGPRAEREPEVGVPVLQVRHPAPARQRRRVDHQQRRRLSR